LKLLPHLSVASVDPYKQVREVALRAIEKCLEILKTHSNSSPCASDRGDQIGDQIGSKKDEAEMSI
jgi:hypothetical protein